MNCHHSVKLSKRNLACVAVFSLASQEDKHQARTCEQAEVSHSRPGVKAYYQELTLVRLRLHQEVQS